MRNCEYALEMMPKLLDDLPEEVRKGGRLASFVRRLFANDRACSMNLPRGCGFGKLFERTSQAVATFGRIEFRQSDAPSYLECVCSLAASYLNRRPHVSDGARPLTDCDVTHG
jgi:hypothetical protein